MGSQSLSSWTMAFTDRSQTTSDYSTLVSVSSVRRPVSVRIGQQILVASRHAALMEWLRRAVRRPVEGTGVWGR